MNAPYHSSNARHAEMEGLELYIVDMKDRILPLWSCAHELFSDVAAVLQQWHAHMMQPNMRAFFASPAFLMVRVLHKKYLRLERMTDTICQLMDVERWINGIEDVVRVRASNAIVCTNKQRVLQELVSLVSHDDGYDVQSSVDRLLGKTRATMAAQQRLARARLDRLASTDEERAEVASIDWTSDVQQRVYEAKWSRVRSNGNALLVLFDIRKAVNMGDELLIRSQDLMTDDGPDREGDLLSLTQASREQTSEAAEMGGRIPMT